MKKAKVMLTVIGILSVVGGALAFKAHRVTGTLYCSTTTAPSAFCTIKADTPCPATTILYCTSNPFNSCTRPVHVCRRL